MADPPDKKDLLKLTVKVDGGLIKVTFSKAVKEIGLDRKEATTFATSILARIGELKE